MEERILLEQKRTNELLEKLISQEARQSELLTAEQVHKEFKIGIGKVRKMFNDKNLAVQTYTVPFKVTRRAIQEYLGERHDYLCEK